MDTGLTLNRVNMTKVNSSPQRHTFQHSRDELAEVLESIRDQDRKNLVNPEWQKDNLEWDLRSTKWICDSAKSTETYAQNLYAALCNNDFQKNEVWTRLENKMWGCSWRHAGGIVADMREEGDYVESPAPNSPMSSTKPPSSPPDVA